MRPGFDDNDRLYVVDRDNNRVQRCEYAGSAWTCSTFTSGFNNPSGLTLDSSDNVYVADSGNYRIRKCDPSGICSDFITGLSGWTVDVAVDSEG
ncbi:MAG: hypothetical protein ACC700_16380, partial [Anaerolineales bacterium]